MILPYVCVKLGHPLFNNCFTVVGTPMRRPS
jgi:hypothetical protein